MSGQRLPIELVQSRGSKHLTKAEIESRTDKEVKPIPDDLSPPAFLSAGQKKTFSRIADQLNKLKIMGETDVDALARYVIASDFYIHAVKEMRKKAVRENPIAFEAWSKVQERYFKQCRSCANDLGLSITSRCKLVVPEAKPEARPENKFQRFESG